MPEEDYTVPIGKAKVVKSGEDITVVAWGALVREAQKAIEEVEKEGISVELIDLRTISPIDKDTIIESVKKTGRFSSYPRGSKILWCRSRAYINSEREGIFIS